MLHGGSYVMEPRAAWLLQVCRVARHPGQTRRAFAGNLNEAGFAADEWTLTRWESGEHKIHLKAGRAYDAILHDGRPLITAALAYIKSSPMRAGRNSRESPVANLDDMQFDALFARVHSGNGTGLDWYNLLIDRRVHEANFLPSFIWTALTTNLLDELPRAVGSAIALRKKALHLITGGGNGVVEKAYRDHLASQTCQVLTSSMLNLVNGKSPAYNRLALDSLRHADARGRWAAMHAVAGKLALGHFRTADLSRISAEALAIVREGPLHDGGEALLRALPVDAQFQIAQSVRNGPLLLKSLTSLHPLSTSWRTLLRTISQEARDDLAVLALQEDVMLEALVTEAIVHPHFEGRIAARILLEASPYRPALARSAARLLALAPPEHQAPLGEFLVFMVGDENREQLIAVVASRQSELARYYALLALGRIPGSLDESDLQAIHQAVNRGTGLIGRGALYALAMHGQLAGEGPDLADTKAEFVRECGAIPGHAIHA